MNTVTKPSVFYPTQASPLLSDIEAAAYLNLSPGTLAVWRCTKRQELPFIKLGRSVRYRLVDIEAWLSAKTVCVTAYGAAMTTTTLKEKGAVHLINITRKIGGTK